MDAFGLAEFHYYAVIAVDVVHQANIVAGIGGGKDAVVALCEAFSLTVHSDDNRSESELTLTLDLDGSAHQRLVPANSVQALLHQRMVRSGLAPSYARSTFAGNEELETGLYIKRLDPVYGEFNQLFPSQ